MTPLADTASKILFFFESPNTPQESHQDGTLTSVLYLLRRELIETAGYDPASGDTEDTVDATGVRRRLFASLIVMFTGFDLLAKFQRGDAEGVGERFKAFLRSPEGGDVSSYTADLFYAARNSLVHAFGVPDADALSRLGMHGVAFDMRRAGVLGDMRGLTVVERQGDFAIIYIDGVFRCWRTAIGRFRESLYGQDAGPKRAVFEEMFDKYGTINIT
jgi:hypothetical protein